LSEISDISKLISNAIDKCDKVGADHTGCYLQMAIDTLASEAKKLRDGVKLAPPNIRIE